MDINGHSKVIGRIGTGELLLLDYQEEIESSQCKCSFLVEKISFCAERNLLYLHSEVNGYKLLHWIEIKEDTSELHQSMFKRLKIGNEDLFDHFEVLGNSTLLQYGSKGEYRFVGFSLEEKVAWGLESREEAPRSMVSWGRGHQVQGEVLRVSMVGLSQKKDFFCVSFVKAVQKMDSLGIFEIVKKPLKHQKNPKSRASKASNYKISQPSSFSRKKSSKTKPGLETERSPFGDFNRSTFEYGLSLVHRIDYSNSKFTQLDFSHFFKLHTKLWHQNGNNLISGLQRNRPYQKKLYLYSKDHIVNLTASKTFKWCFGDYKSGIYADHSTGDVWVLQDHQISKVTILC